MTSDQPYSAAELPGVIADLRCIRAVVGPQTWETLDRLLATVEALVADADTFIGMSAEMIAVGIVSEEWVRSYIGNKLFEMVQERITQEDTDAARAAQEPE